MARFQDSILPPDTRANQPAATTVGDGTLYCVTDEGNIIERSNQTTWDAYSPSASQTGTVVQVVNVETGAVATGTTTIPRDDTKPQNTEGTEFMTLAITPTDAANKLKIEVVSYFSANAAVTIIAALFQDSGADSLAAGMTFDDFSVIFTHYMTAGTTSATTFKVRIGPSSAATVTFNGVSGGRIFGGVMASSITISEIVP